MSSQGNFSRSRKGSIIKCECGFEIPVIPDTQAVGNAIDIHIEQHRREIEDREKGKIAAEYIREYLFTKLFKKIDQMSHVS